MAIGNLFRDEQGRSEAALKMLQEQLALLTEELGKLKGSAMKAGQMLSMYGEYFLPPQANEMLKSLQNQSQPLDWPHMQAVLMQELGNEKLARLSIEPQAHAAASLGQVHIAYFDQQKWALKIQYPGIESAIASDLRAISGLLTLTKILPRKLDQKGFFAEVKSMLEQEADYRIELRYTQAFREWLADDPRYIVPLAQPEFCTSKVMCTQFESGLSLNKEEDFAQVLALPQARRNQLALAVIDLYMREVWQLKHVQTDPHFGNYLVRLDPQGEQDRLILLDFGAVREVPEYMLSGYQRLVMGSIHHDRNMLIEGGVQMGFLSGNEPASIYDLFVRLCRLICEPFMQPNQVDPEAQHLFDQDGCYDWGNSDLPMRLAVQGAEAAMTIRLQAPPREAIFLDRKLSGVFIFLNKLKAKIRAMDVLSKYLPKS
jgi:predicted unusual protein kinase regulating ubiquinone biosynthesis (AarF/ABC1/UbiB family)